MKLWIAHVTFTGESSKWKRPRPTRMSVIVRAKTLDDAAKLTAKFAKRRWPYWKFNILSLNYHKVIE